MSRTTRKHEPKGKRQGPKRAHWKQELVPLKSSKQIRTNERAKLRKEWS